MPLTFSYITDRQKTLVFFAFITFYFLSVFINLGYFPLNGEEPRRALISIEMLHSGNFARPTTMGWDYYNKPPVYNWIQAFSIYLTGSSSELALRLPSLLTILIWGICNFYFVKKMLSVNIAALSTLFFLTSIDIYFWGLENGGEIDIFYGFLVYLQIISIFYYNLKRNWFKLYLYSGLLCAIGFLTKGFPSVLFEILTLVALCIYNKNIRVLLRWQVFIGIAAFLLPVGIYLYYYSFYGSVERFLINLFKESLNKSGLGENPEKFVSKSIGYPLSFLKNLLPWSLFLLLLLKKEIRRVWQYPLVRFATFFILFNIPVYWFTGRPKMRYVYMFLPFAMIIIASVFQYALDKNREMVDKLSRFPVWIFAAILTGLLVMPFFTAVNWTALIFSGMLLVLFIFFYLKAKNQHVWYLGFGLILFRLIYSLALLPERKEGLSLRYDQRMQEIARINNYQPIAFYKKADQLKLEIDLKVTSFDFGIVPDIPYLAYQMPYYYYRVSGQLMGYDTVLKKDKRYIGFRSQVDSLHPQILYSFKDPNQLNEEVILFQLSAIQP